LASPSGDAPKEIGPPRVGVQWTSRSDLGDIREQRGQQAGETPGRDVPEHKKLANSRARAYHLGMEMDLVRQHSSNLEILSWLLIFCMRNLQALYSFISPALAFEGDIPILVILISARTPSVESTDDSSAGPNTGSSRIRDGKRMVVTTPPPPKKAKKVMGKNFGGGKINDPAPKPSST
jgi:hypothetical protein